MCGKSCQVRKKAAVTSIFQVGWPYKIMQNSKVLALKYRPQNLNELVGQEIVAETIYNSIKSNKIPNAFLFTGIRGVGKTTIARIIAKSLNCNYQIDDASKKNPCECSHCESIANSNHIDVLEMDAASKTGVDDVRDLIEFSRYGPTSSKFKIFIIDEVHMLSKQAFNALLKTLEEPPKYLKFIFATTEIKKIPTTIISRCQRFDLSRIDSEKLFNYIKDISIKENGRISDEALKLICKCSEGSVRDALSLLDRAILSTDNNSILDLSKAQKIFGHIDKSQLIFLLENIFKGEEEKCLEIYRGIYSAGVEPSTFLNDFLEIIYYVKNINSLKKAGTNFDLNDKEFSSLQDLSKIIDNQTLLIFWQFTIKTTSELNMVSNPNIAIEMFLLRLLYVKNITQEDFDNKISTNNIENGHSKINNEQTFIGQPVNQIKNVVQTEEPLEKKKNKNEINSFNELIEICSKYKEMRLKYDLETNVNLVNFEKNRIEISFNENLDKNFVKILSEKLLEWTDQRWIITLSKNKGIHSKKEENKIKIDKIIDDFKKTDDYKKITSLFKDAKLENIE